MSRDPIQCLDILCATHCFNHLIPGTHDRERSGNTKTSKPSEHHPSGGGVWHQGQFVSSHGVCQGKE